MKLPPAEISYPRWSQPPEGQQEERVPAAVQSPVSAETADFSGFNECRNGLHCTVPWSAIYYMGTLPLPIWLLRSSTQRYWIAKHANAPHMI